jgi:TRAP-type mannitol/chloroaromatic compound transport system substrate-binding protein
MPAVRSSEDEEGRAMTGRRSFIATAGGLVAAAGAAAIVDAPSVIAQPKVQWRMSTAWPPQLDNLQRSAEELAQVVEETSGGRFKIQVYPGGQIMAPFACFDATSKGEIEGFMAAGTYWVDRDPATAWFSTIPFGMDPQGMAAWYYHGDGLKVWEETFAPFNLIPRLGPGFAPQMGGWFRKKINTLADYKGLKMRIAGLGGQVIGKAGATPVLTPAAEIYPSLERGVIDAGEWVGPHDDMKLGLHKTARYYYYPGWHEPGTVSEFGFNKKAYESLPADLRRILDLAAVATQVHGLMDFHSKNAIALERLKTEFKDKVELVQFPAPVLRELKKIATQVIQEYSEKSPMARKVNASFAKFQALVGPWDRVAEGAYQQLLTG